MLQDLDSKIHSTTDLSFNKQLFDDNLKRFSNELIHAFKKTTKQYALFHVSFLTLGLLEFFAFVLFFSFLTKSAIFAFTIAALFFTGFAYFVLLFYFQVKKPQQLLDLRNTFITQCTAVLPFEKGEPPFHILRIRTLYHLLEQLHRQEYEYYSFSPLFKTVSLLIKKFSVWMHWKDVHQIKEIILFLIIKEYVDLVQLNPTDLEIHSGLANAFIALSRIYIDPRQLEPEEEHLWVSLDYHSVHMQEKFKKAALRAIEELRILDTYAPNDSWVHAQLASLYQDLGIIKEEIKEYEIILALSPRNKEVLFHLGVLYFSQGKNAQALTLYEKLKELHADKAQELLSHYSALLFDEESLRL